MTPAERRFILVLVDLVLVNACLAVSASIWSYFELTPFVLLVTAKWFVTLSIMWLVFGTALGIYDLARAGSVFHGVSSSVTTAGLVVVLYRSIPLLTPPPEPRMLTYALAGLMLISVALWRAAYAALLVQPAFERRALIVGADAGTRRLAQELGVASGDERPNPFRGSGYRVIGMVDGLDTEDTGALDPTQSFLRLIGSRGVDEILVSQVSDLSSAMQDVLLDCREVGIRVTPLAVVYERLAARLPVEYAERDLSLIVTLDDSPAERLYWFLKRVLDIVLGLVGLLAMALLAPWVALANALWAPGPLFYRQQRVGRSGRAFVMNKFRTMITSAETETGAVWAEEHDSRITPLGRWLRRTRLDELPQCVNVLRGEMSFVGPRPERPELVGQVAQSLPIYRGRHAVQPGITGWAQTHYRYGSSLEDARIKLEYDLYYVKHAGLWLDLVILLRTIPVLLRAQGR